MRLFKKEDETVQVLCFPDEEVEKGDYLMIEDFRNGKGLLVQVVDVQFANLPGLMEDLLRENLTEKTVFGDDFDPLNLESQITLLRDVRILMGKIRCSVENKHLNLNISWLPSRNFSRIYKIKSEHLTKILNLGKKRPIKIGKTKEGSDFMIDADDLDGGLSIIVGRKGTGKSHLSKLLMLGLVNHGAPCIVFDVNGEYVNLGFNKNGEKNRYYEKIVVLEPGKNFKVTLTYVGKNILANVLSYILGLPETSLREFFRVWNEVEKTGFITIKRFKEYLRLSNLHEHVKEALLSRFYTIERSGFFVENNSELLKIEDVLQKISSGGVIVLNLSKISNLERKIVVEFMLGKLVELLRRWVVKAVFLFAEEAHLYLRETYWEDIVTRMRHLGLFTVFITNQPDSINQDIYRQADSIFLFNFKNENDLNTIAKVSKVDGETMKSIAYSLEPYHCLVVGQVTKEIPIILKIEELPVKTMGETRKFFN